MSGGDYILGPTMRIGAGYTHSWKHAQRHYNAFERNGVSVNHVWLLGRGTFLLSNGVLNYDNFNQPDAALSAKERRDTTWRASATYGVPLTLLHPKLQDLLLAFTYEYYQALSTVENFAYTNNKIGTLLTYKFDLGF